MILRWNFFFFQNIDKLFFLHFPPPFLKSEIRKTKFESFIFSTKRLSQNKQIVKEKFLFLSIHYHIFLNDHPAKDFYPLFRRRVGHKQFRQPMSSFAAIKRRGDV